MKTVAEKLTLASMCAGGVQERIDRALAKISDRDCTTCVKSGECHLLELAHRMGVDRIRFKNREAKYPIDESSPAIVRNPNKCILCGDCVRMCDNVQSVNAIDFAYRGTSTLVTPAFNKTIAQTNCVNCGQCRVVCPTGAISIKTNIDEVWDALADPNTIVVAQVAPAVRVALGDKFGIPKGENVIPPLPFQCSLRSRHVLPVPAWTIPLPASLPNADESANRHPAPVLYSE